MMSFKQWWCAVAHAMHSYMLANVCRSALQARTGRSDVFKQVLRLRNHGVDRHIRDITAVTLQPARPFMPGVITRRFARSEQGQRWRVPRRGDVTQSRVIADEQAAALQNRGGLQQGGLSGQVEAGQCQGVRQFPTGC